MLDEITPEQFDEWMAFRKLEPDPEERVRTILVNGLGALCHAWGVKLSREDLDPALKEQTAVQEVTPEQALAMARASYGV